MENEFKTSLSEMKRVTGPGAVKLLPDNLTFVKGLDLLIAEMESRNYSKEYQNKVIMSYWNNIYV